MPTPISNPTLMGRPVSVHGGAWPKTHRVDGTPLLPPSALPSPSQPQPLVPRRMLSSTLSGENGEEVDERGALIRNIEENFPSTPYRRDRCRCYRRARNTRS